MLIFLTMDLISPIIITHPSGITITSLMNWTVNYE
jgi:hypothetical protein